MINPHILKNGTFVYSREHNRFGVILDIKEPHSSRTQDVLVRLEEDEYQVISSDRLNVAEKLK